MPLNRQKYKSSSTRLLPAALLAGLLLGQSACAPTVDNRGNLITAEQLNQISVGTSTQDDVRRVLGSPTLVAPFNQRVWYYTGQQTETFGVLNADVLEQRTLMLEFDTNNMLQHAEIVDPNLQQEIDVVDRKTPTKGRELTVLQQLFGNLGRFNKPAK